MSKQLTIQKTLVGLVRDGDTPTALVVYDERLRTPVFYKVEKMCFDDVLNVFPQLNQGLNDGE